MQAKKVMIIDPHKESHEFLKKMLEEMCDVELIDNYDNKYSLLESLINNIPDIVFIWLESNSFSGIHLAKEIRKQRLNTRLIFFSNSTRFAVDAFELEAADYLVFPFDMIRLTKAFRNAYKY